ncbi:hypothetical protein Efla_006111 [Eimeria flavescens]
MAVSRSFGDRDLKAEGLITATPEVVLVPITPALRFIVLACDGVWDALSDQASESLLVFLLRLCMLLGILNRQLAFGSKWHRRQRGS